MAWHAYTHGHSREPSDGRTFDRGEAFLGGLPLSVGNVGTQTASVSMTSVLIVQARNFLVTAVVVMTSRIWWISNPNPAYTADPFGG